VFVGSKQARTSWAIHGREFSNITAQSAKDGQKSGALRVLQPREPGEAVLTYRGLHCTGRHRLASNNIRALRCDAGVHEPIAKERGNPFLRDAFASMSSAHSATAPLSHVGDEARWPLIRRSGGGPLFRAWNLTAVLQRCLAASVQ
jgi:hypothetical protein